MILKGSASGYLRPRIGADGAVLTLQPPGRFVAVFKHLTDRDGQRFGFVVGLPSEDGFVVNIEEVERTLDLLQPPVQGHPRPAWLPASSSSTVVEHSLLAP